MERNEAISALEASAPDDRLRAARYLALHPDMDALPALQKAFYAESHKWVKAAIRQALAIILPGPKPQVESGSDDEDTRILNELRAEAVEQTTKRLVHELRQIIGRLDVYAAGEIPNYQDSATKAECKKLQDFLGFLAQLGNAAASPTYVEFDLAATIEEIAAANNQESTLAVQCSGSKPHLIVGAPDAIRVIVSNAIRNAVEATTSIRSSEPVVVSWGTTDRDHWISVIDRGCGLPSNYTAIFEIGVTNKRGHMGVGLTLAKQAAEALNGKVRLSPREPSGTAFEFSWPLAIL